MAICGDEKHDSGNEVNLVKVGNDYGIEQSERILTLHMLGSDLVRLRLLTSTKGKILVELLQGLAREDCVDKEECSDYNAALDTLESLIMAHASEGIDVTSGAYQNGVQTTLDAITNNL